MKRVLPVHCCMPNPGSVPHMSAENAEKSALLLKAIADPMRLRILSLIESLGGKGVCACEFPGVLGISQPTASHHLKKLTDAGFVSREQHGKWAYYTLVPDTFAAARELLQVSVD